MDIISELTNKLNTNGKVMFKLYSLDYIIEKTNDKFTIYPEIYPPKLKQEFNSLQELLDNYYIYNESISSNLERVSNIN